jgi:bifunctional DNase/RNase
MVEMELIGVSLELPANAPVVHLREQAGARVLPIYIGPEEARAIAYAVEGVVTPRPMTHDLLRDTLEALGATVNRITVTDLRDRTFYAELELRIEGRTVRVSSRPSDAIALAVRVAAPIFAAEAVLDEAAAAPEEERTDPEAAEEIVDQFREFIDQVNPDDFAWRFRRGSKLPPRPPPSARALPRGSFRRDRPRASSVAVLRAFGPTAPEASLRWPALGALLRWALTLWTTERRVTLP